MRINGIRCDQCNREHLFEPGAMLLSYLNAVPSGWLIVSRGQERVLFCSVHCMREWTICQKDYMWDEISSEQEEAVDRLSNHMHAHMVTETNLFHEEYPDLRVEWSFRVLNVKFREQKEQNTCKD